MAREKGDGSLRKLSNKHWEGRISYRNAKGERIFRQVTARTHADAKKKLDTLLEQVELEKKIESDPTYLPANNYLFSEWLDVWQSEILPNAVKPATLESYHRNVENHIKPELGELYLQQVRSLDIQTLVNKMVKQGFMPWTVNKAKNVISSAFTAAMEQTPPLVLINPCKGVKTPAIKQKPIRVLSEDEQKHFMKIVQGTRFDTLFLFALATGMRRGEIIALTWDCVDFKKQQIKVISSVNRIMDVDTKKTSLVEGDTKSVAGFRMVPILPNFSPVLKAHKQEQEAIRKKAGSAWNDKNLVFCSTVGEWIEPRRIQTELDLVLKAHGVEPFSPHALRHTYATRMLEREVPIKVVSEILGHADVKTTMQVYSHVFDTTAHNQANKLDGLFAGLTNEKAPVTEQAHYPEFKRQNTKAKNRAGKSQSPKKKAKSRAK